MSTKPPSNESRRQSFRRLFEFGLRLDTISEANNLTVGLLPVATVWERLEFDQVSKKR
jgi:hypothetical protein